MKIRYEGYIEDCSKCPLIIYDENGHGCCPYGCHLKINGGVYGSTDIAGRKALIPYSKPTDIHPCPIEVK